ncbi:MAG: hypothetical protein PHS60_14055 [Zavarzinia sp.]|nr:hypothetical protein [Zavarzinia sp.]
MGEILTRALVFYSPPLRVMLAAGPCWTFETLVVGRDGKARRLPSTVTFPEGEGRKACAAHVVAQMRVDRETARRRGQAAVGLVAVVDLASWEDLLSAHGVDEGGTARS